MKALPILKEGFEFRLGDMNSSFRFSNCNWDRKISEAGSLCGYPRPRNASE